MAQASHFDWTSQAGLAPRCHSIGVSDEFVARLQREVSNYRCVENLISNADHRFADSSALLEIASWVREKLLFGSGLVVLSGAELAQFSDAELEVMHFLICMGMGRPMWQNTARDLIVRVEDTRPVDPDRARGFTSNTRMLLHTDGWDCAGLMCLSEAVSGGMSLFASSETMYSAIAAEAPDLLRLFLKPWEWDIRSFTDDETRKPILAPVFSVFEGRLSCRYGSSMLRNGPRAAGRELSANCALALDLFEAIASRESLVLRHQLQRGQSVWMNNCQILHGRDAFQDSPDKLSRRRLSRVWAKVNGAPRKAAEFAAFDAETFGQIEM